jgi:hypothetical protein
MQYHSKVAQGDTGSRGDQSRNTTLERVVAAPRTSPENQADGSQVDLCPPFGSTSHAGRLCLAFELSPGAARKGRGVSYGLDATF